MASARSESFGRASCRCAVLAHHVQAATVTTPSLSPVATVSPALIGAVVAGVSLAGVASAVAATLAIVRLGASVNRSIDSKLELAALSGLRAVELARAVQARAAGLYLSDMGADVIKVEQARLDGEEHGGQGGMKLAALDFGKRSIILDAHSEEGREALRTLLLKADIFLSDYPHEDLEDLGLTYQALRSRNPRLVFAAGASPTVLDEGTSGESQSFAPTELALGIMTALVLRERHSVGQYVESARRPPGSRRPPPLAGAHSVEILREIGYRTEGIQRLLAANAQARMVGTGVENQPQSRI
eukprot:gnl/TRDRNA2_/TRDRNA2_34473_c0_seq1.p1 gnl/TRDRNA2_/TRDRNA2_34473_c0~~gnl/TRDRNA2_/TRDRNA2_34473_c0_seq1.p1  ORF type:complete len:301 (-),score=33.63 gnl/TRDRNA2_/TRDRNA2_34473_c0_seq1:17-919(-)